jgi:hypothetical protein
MRISPYSSVFEGTIELDRIQWDLVIPAKAGIQGKRGAVALGPCLRGDDEEKFDFN